MIDSHCHLDHEPMYSDLKNVIQRSKDTGISKILSICTTKSSFSKITKIIDFDPIIYGTFGIHPHECSKDVVTKNEIISNVKEHNKIIAIGESGLDFYYNHSDKNTQIESFKTHIEAALKCNCPIIVHSRSAEDDTLKIFTVPIGDMHQANIPPRTGVSYTDDKEHRFQPLSQEYLTKAEKPEGYVPGIQKKTDDGFEGTREWGQKMLAQLKSGE